MCDMMRRSRRKKGGGTRREQEQEQELEDVTDLTSTVPSGRIFMRPLRNVSPQQFPLPQYR